MDSIGYILIGVVLLIVIYSAALVSYHTVRSVYFEKGQKTAILAMAWLIPIIGPALILSILSEHKPRERRPGVPFLDLIFLAAVLSQNSDSDSATREDSSYSTSDLGGNSAGNT